MITKPKQRFIFAGTCRKSKTLRQIVVMSDSIITADKAAKAKLENCRMISYAP